MSIEDSELFAGLAFLMRHAHPAYSQYLEIAERACRSVRQRRNEDDLRMTPIDDLEISIRLLTALKALKLETAGHIERLLCDHREEDLLSSGEAKNARFGKKCLKECRELMRNLGLRTGE